MPSSSSLSATEQILLMNHFTARPLPLELVKQMNPSATPAEKINVLFNVFKNIEEEKGNGNSLQRKELDRLCNYANNLSKKQRIILPRYSRRKNQDCNRKERLFKQWVKSIPWGKKFEAGMIFPAFQKDGTLHFTILCGAAAESFKKRLSRGCGTPFYLAPLKIGDGSNSTTAGILHRKPTFVHPSWPLVFELLNGTVDAIRAPKKREEELKDDGAWGAKHIFME